MTSNTSSARQATFRREGAVLMLGSSLTIVGAVMVGPILPKLFMEFGPIEPRADVLVPLAITGPALTIALFAPLAGWLADRMGRKALLILATILYAFFGAMPALLDTLPGIVSSRLLFGCAEAAIMTCCAALIADYWKGEQRMKMVNFQVVTIGLMGALFFVIGGALGEKAWRAPFYLYLLPLLLVPFMARILWEPISVRQQQVEQGDDRISVGTLVVGYLLIFCGMLLNFIVPVQTPVLLVEMGVTSSTLIGASAGLGLLTSLAGALMWPLIRKTVGIAGCNALLLSLLALGLWLLSRAESYNEVLFAVALHGLGAGLLVPNAMAPVMNALSADTRGRGLGGFTSFLYLGQFASPLLIAMLGGFRFDLRGAIELLAVLSLIGGAIWVVTAILTPRNATGIARTNA